MTSRLLVAVLLAAGWGSIARADSGTGEVNFAREIQPLLAKHCLLCHGPDEAEAGLRLDTEVGAKALLDSGLHAVVPGNADESELVRRIADADESLRMPPEGEPLSRSEQELLRRWIDGGAKYEVHWAYRPVTVPEVPDVDSRSSVRNPIDRFVLARLEREGLGLSPQADRATLIRRLSYDLVGLPPSPQQVDAFVNDPDADAYGRLVDRLLASEHFGERWGRHWLDKARYADSDGYEKDRPRPNAWRYRDWVIDAINQDVPFDRFTIEQLAGDLLPEATPNQKLATAFHRQTLTNTEGGTDQEEFRVEATFDRTETTAAVWMGMTMTCARCHSHKYDQITQNEYYQLFAFFNGANEANTDVPKSEWAWRRYLQQKSTHEAKLRSVRANYEKALVRLQPEIDRWIDEVTSSADAASPVRFHPARLREAKADSDAVLTELDDRSLLVSGPVVDKDRYTIILEPEATELTGIRLELLPDESLSSNGPGRAPNGNFVLSEFRASLGKEGDDKKDRPIEFVGAEADFAQNKFAPERALSTDAKSGWAISPQMGKPHQLTLFTRAPVVVASGQTLQIVLDQQYGGSHTIGRFRIETMTGFDPMKALPEQVASALKAEKRSEDQSRAIAQYVGERHGETRELSRQLQDLLSKAPKPPTLAVRVMTPAKRSTRLLHRGDFLQPADEVEPGALAVITRTHPLTARGESESGDRLDLARWLVDPHHPLTARVTVNHVWAHLFGRGIVPTVNDFGVRGEPPTHPLLLDWLAWQFANSMDWSRKRLIKTVVMSATYRQSSHHRPELNAVDPTNLLLARQNRIRVEAEVVRDLYLAVSGLLSEKVGGPSVFPPLPPGVAALSYANNFKWKTSGGEDRYRRGMYTFFKRTSPHPTLVSFDCPDSNTTRLRRDASNTPLQALVTLNNDVFAESAQAMARRVLADGGDRDVDRLVYALRLCIGRTPDEQEIESFRTLLDTAREYYQSHPQDAETMSGRHTASGQTAAENAAWVATVRMVLNLDEFIVRD